MVTSITEMMPKTGLAIAGPDPQTPVPATAAEIRKNFETTSKSLVEEILSNWTDDTLNVEDELYGFNWKRGYTLFVLIVHQTHHLG